MPLITCPFCHKELEESAYLAHKATHTALKPDGQMNDHVTVHPKGRYQGSLKGVPQAYRHPKCKVVTGMPEEIIRSYLVNPFLYNDFTFCCGCNGYVNGAEVFWVETGESLTDYRRTLKEEYIRKHGEPPPPTKM